MNNTYITNRNNKNVLFNRSKIVDAITLANKDCGFPLSQGTPSYIAEEIEKKAGNLTRTMSIEEIGNEVIRELEQYSHQVAEAYRSWRDVHTLRRVKNSTDYEFETLRIDQNEFLTGENANRNPKELATKKNYYSGLLTKDYAIRNLYSEDVVSAHLSGLIHIHDIGDIDSFNCCNHDYGDMLNGCSVSGVSFKRPKRIATAAKQVAEFLTQNSGNQYGGETLYISDLAAYIEPTRQYYKNLFEDETKEFGIEYTDEQIERLIEKRVKKEIADAVQTLQYELITQQTTNGQTPFVTFWINDLDSSDSQTQADTRLLAEEIFKQRMEGILNTDGIKIYPTFPKLVYNLHEDNVRKDSKYYDLTKLAEECSIKTMTPDFTSHKQMLIQKGTDVPPMGCRSFQKPWKVRKEYQETEEFKRLLRALPEGIFVNEDDILCEPDGRPRIKGRPNMGVVTLNIPWPAIMAGEGNVEKFFEFFDEVAELVHKAQLERVNKQLKGMLSDTSPILFQNGGYCRLQPGENINPLIYEGYSSISFGYSGLAEAVEYLTGKDYQTEESQELAQRILKHMNDLCDSWAEEDRLGWSVYGTPMESTIGKFADALTERFGVIKGFTDKGFISNSYHIPVTTEIDAFTKLAIESKLSPLSPGGNISYVEVPNLVDNPEAMHSLIEFMYENNLYAEINERIDQCLTCGYHGEMDVVEDVNGNLLFKCPQCGETEPAKLDIIRRMCGYIGRYVMGWNKGRFEEIANRVFHL